MDNKCPECGGDSLKKEYGRQGFFVSYYRMICKACDYIGEIKRETG